MNKYEFNPEKYKEELISIISEAVGLSHFTQYRFERILKKYPKDGNKIFSKDNIIRGIEWIKENRKEIATEFEMDSLISKIKMKPTRTISGVTTVTVLTKPFACPGKCIFCPNDIRMPKSYIASEPGAQRALVNRFSPYLQVYTRLKAYKNIGHPTDKIELIILGGTWSYYTEKYKIWFISECFRAMNEFSIDSNILISENDSRESITNLLKNDINQTLRKDLGGKPYNQLIASKEYKLAFAEENIVKESEYSWEDLEKLQEINSHSKSRCVGLVLETRSDVINDKEVYIMRKLGATKIQLGIQTFDDEISEMNKRGETKSQVANAFLLLRAGGFKIHGHIMPNLYGATPSSDFEVYKELFESPEFKPDELKIYPTSIIKNTELYELWKEGKYKPYSIDELVNLLANCIEFTPEYCRLTRIIRDIPSQEIEDGNKTTNLREIVEYKLKKEGRKNQNIRAREIKGQSLKSEDLILDIKEYNTKETTEYFLQYITKDRLIAGFLRLSLPTKAENRITNELDKSAMIREVHVYGPSLELSKDSDGQAQHLGLGSKLIEEAKKISKEKGFSRLAVISAIGTREYYEKRGFKLTGLYQVAEV
jgi:elongator complex protein 3